MAGYMFGGQVYFGGQVLVWWAGSSLVGRF